VDQSTASASDAYSAEFVNAVQRVLADEGGDSSNPADAGGATRFGISARAHPGVDIATLTRDAAVKIYWDEWWVRFGFAQLPAAVAAKTFNLAVNMGASNAAALMAAMRSEFAAHYRLVAAKQNRDQAFLKGWLNRAYA
jgi:lysozyme family protein